jgi:eukaryotic-like serine/threonine-protein kinase
MMGPPGPENGSAEMAGDPSFRIGKILQGRYRIVSRIASGGMGSVYRGERLGLGRPVAIKFLHAAMARDPQVMKRFEREAQAMSRLAHPNCIAVLDFGVDELPYLVMDLVHGAPLRATIDAGVVAPRRALKIARQLLSALSHAHAQGIVHRDIKPENVVLEATPGLHDHVRVLDFGLAKMMGSESGLTVGMAIGTPNYMAPEQTREGSVDHRADLYAVGIVLYEMLTGKKPFDSTELGEVFLKQLGMPMPRLRDTAPAAGFSAELDAVIQRAADKDPERRFPDADTMNAALEAVPEAMATPGPAVASALLASELKAGPPAAAATPPPPAVDATIQEPMTAKLAAAMLPTSPPLPAVPRLAGLTSHPLRLAAVSAVVSALLVALGAALFLPGKPAPAHRPAAAPVTPGAAASGGPGKAAEAPAPSASGAPDEAAGAAPATRPPGGRPTSARAAAPVKRPVSGAHAAEGPAAQARALFEARRWSEGLDAYRAAIKLDPARRGDKTLVRPLIASLDSDSKGERAAFLRELGGPARPLLREAARSHPNPRVRARAAELSRPASPPSPGPPKKRPFLRWL